MSKIALQKILLSIWFFVIIVGCSLEVADDKKSNNSDISHLKYNFGIDISDINRGYINYYSNNSLSKSNSSVTRAIIVIHGTNRDALDYFNVINDVTVDKLESDNTIIIAPHFKEASDEANSSEFQWSDKGGWKVGSNSTSKVSLDRISSFTIIDKMITTLSDENLFPNLTDIVITGHSAGGQFTQRYAFTSQIDKSLDKNFHYIIANSGSYLYLTNERVDNNGFSIPYTTCSSYNEYKYGLDNPYAYFVGEDNELLKNQYISKKVIYLLGTDDTNIDTNLDTSCEANLQGDNRYERGLNYWNYINYLYFTNNHLLLKVKDIGHSKTGIYSSTNGKMALFSK
ncbi:MAG: hypothetical protein QM493_06975 [Sulfurovum sp.]